MKQLKVIYQITNRNPWLEKYFQEIGKVSLITTDEEVDLVKRIHEGDKVALEKLVKANLRFVVSVAKQYDKGSHGLTLGDLINEGNIGLIKAATKFDETRGFKFISYAVWWIRQGIMSAISNDSRLVRQPMNQIATYNKLIRSFVMLEQRYEREPTNEEVAQDLEISEHSVSQIKKVGTRHSSLDAPLRMEEASNLLDVVNDPDAISPDASLLYGSLKVDINLVLKKLTSRESEILILSFGLNNNHSLTLHEIANRLGVTSERVRQIKERALFKISQNSTSNRLLKPYLS